MPRQSGRALQMLDEVMQFVEPNGAPFTLTIVGCDADAAIYLLDRFARMLAGRGYPVTRQSQFVIQSGNTRIRFCSSQNREALLGRNSRTMFWDSDGALSRMRASIRCGLEQ